MVMSRSIARFPAIESQMAAVYLSMNLLAALAATAMLPLLHRLVSRLSPATSEEDLSKPQFLQERALLDGESAIELVVREQDRLFQRLPLYLEGLRRGAVRRTLLSASFQPRPAEVEQLQKPKEQL